MSSSEINQLLIDQLIKGNLKLNHLETSSQTKALELTVL